jgi:1,4-alpha-glucan branching enzyme
MGGELGQPTEWNEKDELPWWLLTDPAQGALHGGIQRLIRELNAIYRREPALYELDDEQAGFEWIDANDAPQSVASFLRFPRSELRRRRTGRFVVVVGNFTPIVRDGYVVGVPRSGRYLEVLNTDASSFGGSNLGNLGAVEARPEPSHGHPFSLSLRLPPLAVLWLVPEAAGLATTDELAGEAEPAVVVDGAVESADVVVVDGTA